MTVRTSAMKLPTQRVSFPEMGKGREVSGEKGVGGGEEGRGEEGRWGRDGGGAGGGGGAGDNSSSCIRMYMYILSAVQLIFKSVIHVHGPAVERTRCSLRCGSKRASGLFSLVSTNFVHVVHVEF